MNLEEMALNDFDLFKQNKIYEYELNKKLYNEQYREIFINELKKEANSLIERGYSIDVDSYPLDQINMIRTNSEKNITEQHKDFLEKAFNDKYPLGITDEKIVSSAIDDFEKYKNNKITNFEIGQKIERNEEYKQAMIKLFKKEANNLNTERGYNFDVENYAKDKIDDILLYQKQIPKSHLKDLYIEFEEKFGNDFPLLSNNAKNDFDLFKQNKIPDAVIANKIENDPLYKDSMKILFKQMGDELIKSGQTISDINLYADQKINSILDSIKSISTNEKVDIIRDYEQKNSIPAEYTVTSFDIENDSIRKHNVKSLSIEDVLNIESTKNILSIERTDVPEQLLPFSVDEKLIFSKSINDIKTESNNVIAMSNDDVINYYKNISNENELDFNKFSSKMTAFLDSNNNKDSHLETTIYLINELNNSPEKFNNYSSLFFDRGTSENQVNSNIKIGNNIKEALKDRPNKTHVFVETVKKKVIKETKSLLNVVENTKKSLLEKPLKSIQDKLFSKAIVDAEKKLEQQNSNQKTNQKEKAKNLNISF